VLPEVNHLRCSECLTRIRNYTRFKVSARRLTVRFPNGTPTHSTPKYVQIPAEYHKVLPFVKTVFSAA